MKVLTWERLAIAVAGLTCFLAPKQVRADGTYTYAGYITSSSIGVKASSQREEKLSAVLVKAIELMPAGDKITITQVVVAADGLEPVVKSFFDRYRSAHGNLSADALRSLSKKEGATLTFVRAEQPPAFTPDDEPVTYVNGRCSLYQVALKQYSQGVRQWAYVWAAKLAHESRHLHGDHEELPAYQHEVQLLSAYRSSGLLKGAIFDQYLEYLRSGLADPDSQKRIVLRADRKQSR